jgi:hypothetical protein
MGPKQNRVNGIRGLGINFTHVLAAAKLAWVFVGLVKIGRSKSGNRRRKEPMLFQLLMMGLLRYSTKRKKESRPSSALIVSGRRCNYRPNYRCGMADP